MGFLFLLVFIIAMFWALNRFRKSLINNYGALAKSVGQSVHDSLKEANERAKAEQADSSITGQKAPKE